MKAEDKTQTWKSRTGFIELHPRLKRYTPKLRVRSARDKRVRRRINGEDRDGLIGRISLGHRYFGFNHGEMDGQNGVWYGEWAPGADYLALIGDFSDWNKDAHSLGSVDI